MEERIISLKQYRSLKKLPDDINKTWGALGALGKTVKIIIRVNARK